MRETRLETSHLHTNGGLIGAAGALGVGFARGRPGRETAPAGASGTGTAAPTGTVAPTGTAPDLVLRRATVFDGWARRGGSWTLRSRVIVSPRWERSPRPGPRRSTWRGWRWHQGSSTSTPCRPLSAGQPERGEPHPSGGHVGGRGPGRKLGRPDVRRRFPGHTRSIP